MSGMDDFELLETPSTTEVVEYLSASSNRQQNLSRPNQKAEYKLRTQNPNFKVITVYKFLGRH